MRSGAEKGQGGRAGVRQVYDGTRPDISIILPVLNVESILARTVEGIQRQKFARRELIVIDGGSSDGTADLLRNLGGEVDYWSSAADRGIYDAMSRGIDAARGQWLYFIGADDAFVDDRVLEDVIGFAANLSDVDLIVGNVLIGDGGRTFKSRFDNRLYLRNTVHHQAAFYRRQVFRRLSFGHLTKNGRRPFRISGDYHLNLSLYLSGGKARYIDRVIARCAGGASQQGRPVGYLEEIVIRHRLLPFPAAALFDIQTLARFFLKQWTRHIR